MKARIIREAPYRLVRASRLWFQKVTGTSLVQTRASLANWKTLCQPSSKWVPFSNQRKLKQQKERGGFVSHLLWPRYSGPPTPSPLRLLSFEKMFYLFINCRRLMFSFLDWSHWGSTGDFLRSTKPESMFLLTANFCVIIDFS